MASEALDTFLTALDRLLGEAESRFAAVATSDDLEQARVDFLGARAGRLKSVQAGLAAVPGSDKPAAGQKLNAVKQGLTGLLESAQARLVSTAVQSAGPRFDPTLPGEPSPRLGSIHPITQTIGELVDIMGRLGFTVVEGPEIEDEWHNFDALNIPPVHPARHPRDNFYLAAAEAVAPTGREAATAGNGIERGGRATAWDGPVRMLRSQTSTVQIRVMESIRPPIRVISLGRVYRPDEVDATHYPMFHQMEGLSVAAGTTMAHLKTVLRLFAESYFGQDVPIRFRPSFFPFTEPSVEVDFYWNDRWLEFGGAGMVDPNVLSAVGYDPEEVTGFAFGLGIERLCMRRHNIDDIRNLYSSDVRFLRQF